jgi:TFIIF-interacting CTD phosphatase-like protein
MTNLYKNITNSLNIIISKYHQFIPSLSKEFETLIKNIRTITYTELYNFYFDYIKNQKKIKEFQLDLNDSKIKNNKVFQSYHLFNKNKNNINNNFKKEIRGLSVDNLNNNMNRNYNQNILNSSNNSFRTIKSENLNYILNKNNLNTYSSDGLYFPHKKIRSQSQDEHNNNLNYQYYNLIQTNNNSDNIKIIINDITNPNDPYSNINKSELINEINHPINKNVYSPNQNSERNKKSHLFEILGNTSPESKSISSRNTPLNRKYINNSIERKNNSHNKIYRKKILSLPLIPFPNNKEYTLLIHLDDTIIHIPNKSSNIYLRNGLFEFLNYVNQYYEIISFTNGNENYSDQIINLIESNGKYFDYCLHRDNATYLNEEYYKDIKKIGRDVKKTIIIDDKNNNLGIEDENTIFIKSFIFNENDNKYDNVLKNLCNILISIAKDEPDDIRKSIRMNKRKL